MKARPVMWFAIAVLGTPTLVSTVSAQHLAPLRLIQTIPMPNVMGRIDHFGIDVKGKRLFVAALGENQNTVEVIDLAVGKRVFSIPGQSRPQGVFYSPDFNKLLVANGTTAPARFSARRTSRL